jgi:hypothetical protein
MSSEKHLEGDTGELSESEALLGCARSTTVLPEPRSPTLDRLAGHCPGDLSAITKRLKELADQKGAYKLKYREKISMVWSCAVMVLGSRSLWRYLEKNKSSFRHGPGESEALGVFGEEQK